MGTQWRKRDSFLGLRWDGLDYGALPIPLAANRGNPHRQPLSELMRQLGILERAAMKQLNGSNDG